VSAEKKEKKGEIRKKELKKSKEEEEEEVERGYIVDCVVASSNFRI